jgi:hypothetical protein
VACLEREATGRPAAGDRFQRCAAMEALGQAAAGASEPVVALARARLLAYLDAAAGAAAPAGEAAAGDAGGRAVEAEPLVWAAGLAALQRLGAKEPREVVVRVALRGLGQPAPWNVRVAALGVVAKCVQEQDFALVREAVRTELVEARKSAVLLAALGCARVGLLRSEIQALTAHAEPAVAKAAFDALKLA